MSQRNPDPPRQGVAYADQWVAYQRERLATGYTTRRFGLPRRPIPDIATRAMSPATGFYSTAEDLCRYAAGHCLGNDVLLSDAAKREMQQPYWKVEQADEHYGLGFNVLEVGERRMVGHGGGFPGHSTRTMIDPRDRLVVVVLTNEIAGPAAALARTIVRILDFAAQPRALGGQASIPYDRFTGRFVNMGGVLDVAAFGDALVALDPDDDDPVKSATELAVEDENTLRITKTNGYASPGETIRYLRDDAGQVTKIVAGGESAYPLAIFRQRHG